MANAYDGYTEEDLQIAAWDNHPNALAHLLIAARLFDEFVANPQLVSKRNGTDGLVELTKEDTQWDRSDKR
jgi:hypothetical protein